MPIVIAVDGPASSGKSTVARELASRLNLVSLDTGLLYRLIAQECENQSIPATDESAVAGVARSVLARVSIHSDRSLQQSVLTVDGKPISEESLHSPRISAAVAHFANKSSVRAEVRRIQQELIDRGGVIMAGRDIGTVVAPLADYKIYLDVSLEERAARRYWGQPGGSGSTQAEIEEQLAERDRLDMGRTTSPLRVSGDAVVLRSDGMTLPQTVDVLIEMCGLVPEKGSSRA